MSTTGPGPYPTEPPPPRRPPGETAWSPSGGGSPWASSAGRRTGERVTSRVRRVVEGLPDWEPLPPGETLVRRPGGSV
ncbi:hypothetical protein OG896_13145 [Streptomyces sp. NBC_00669]|uniref:hypothetical protein n=1 Tax=Streptomyces sp. NBC_00669 TaxID=2976011 RepID=UPI002E2F0C6B|nr:hypothetical protein [Streptomyces sp. NBC_00669]